MGDGGFVEIADRADLGVGEFALEGPVAALDAGDELGDIILFGRFLRFDLAARLIVETAAEANLLQQLFRRAGGKIEQRVFLTDLGGDNAHGGKYERGVA